MAISDMPIAVSDRRRDDARREADRIDDEHAAFPVAGRVARIARLEIGRVFARMHDMTRSKLWRPYAITMRRA